LSARLDVLDDPAAACAERLVEAAAGGGQLVLTGGSTPRAAYELAARKPDPWGHATIWFSDERCVPPDDERSNYRMVEEALLAPLAKAPPTVHRMRGELGPDAGAEAYESELLQAGSPEFDLMLLGLGPDGHLASLFGDQQSLFERSHLVVGVAQAGLEPFVPRISLTLSAIASARRILFLVTGASKAEAVAKAFGPNAKPDPHVPASLLPPLARDITVLLDTSAAGRNRTAEGP
jgi:6-phosphogluconolactonase